MSRWPNRTVSIPMLAVSLLSGGCTMNHDPLRPGDIACLDYMTAQNGGAVSDMKRAVAICRADPVPNLSGDEDLQERFLVQNIPFRVQPVLDQKLKFARRFEYMPPIGSNIPQQLIFFQPNVTVTEHDPTPVSGGSTAPVVTSATVN